MTRETTRLAAHPARAAQWQRYFAFLLRPALPADPAATRTAAAGGLAVLHMFALDLLVMLGLLAVGAAVIAVGFELPRTALAGLAIDWKLALLVVALAPLSEELMFRSWLSGKPGHVLALLVLLLGAVAAGALGVGKTGAAATTAVGAAVVAAVLLACLGLWWLRRRPAMRWFRVIFPALFWFSTLGFASLHLLNYSGGNIAVLVPLVLPQAVLGSMLGYLRVHYGLWTAILLHAAHNGLLIGLVALASRAAG